MRLIDLHVDWLLQYAPETTVFDPALYPGVAERWGQLEGYLQATRAAVLACYRRADDWAQQPDPWAGLGGLITRIEAEFPGRLLIGPDDFDRWQDDRDGLTWGLIGVEGFDALVRSDDDLGRLPRLFERGVRLFQPVYGADNRLGGSSSPGDDRGLAGLGRRFLEALDAVGSGGLGPRPLVDLAHMNASTMGDVLTWFESEPSRARRLLPVYSHGSPAHSGFESPRAITLENLRRLRALGGHVGLGVSPPFFQSPAQVKEAVELVASIPFEGREGPEGIAIGTDFMGVDRTLPGLGHAAEVVAWFLANFDRSTAKDLLHDNALNLMARATGAVRQP
jgi:membrane dipeptidase